MQSRNQVAAPWWTWESDDLQGLQEGLVQVLCRHNWSSKRAEITRQGEQPM
jgi:hypothetical protein